MTNDRLERIRLGIYVLVISYFSFVEWVFFAKTVDPKHEHPRVINTSLVNLTRFVFV